MADYVSKVAAPTNPYGDAFLLRRTDTPADQGGGTDGNFGIAQCNSAGNLRVMSEGGVTTYVANSQFACDSTATDIWYIPGSATKTVKVLWIQFSAAITTAAIGVVQLIRRSAANTAGTAVASTLAKMSSGNAAATCAPSHYTAHPTGLGTTANVLWSHLYRSEKVDGTGVLPTLINIDFRPMVGEQCVRLSGTAEILALSAAAALGGSGNAWHVSCCFTEEPTTA